MTRVPGILCLAHLPWDFVWQRPQQILSRLSRTFPVLYVNEPEIDQSAKSVARLEKVPSQGGVLAWQPVFPDRAAILERWRENYLELVRDLLVSQGWAEWEGERLLARRPIVLWFYTPIPFYFMDSVPAEVIVYDVMDELKDFKGAAADMPEREAHLLERADLVFAGGRTLFEARKDRHPNIHLYPSGVEPGDFARALAPETQLAAELAALPGPVLGYIGVIDERIDLPLLASMADMHPEWSLVMVGPVRKIEKETLPQRPNIHYLGQQPYDELPQFLKGFDVCLIPFAMNRATRSLSPTKTLEYMAAHKPIVSTPVPDIVATWSDVVWIAEDVGAFAAAVEAALAEPGAARRQRHARESTHIKAGDWDTIVAQIQERLCASLGMNETKEGTL